MPTEFLQITKSCKQYNDFLIKASSRDLSWCMNCDILFNICSKEWAFNLCAYFCLISSCDLIVGCFYRNLLLQNCTDTERAYMDHRRTPDVLYLWMISICQPRRHMELSHQLNCSDSTSIMAIGQYVWCSDSVQHCGVQNFENMGNSSAYFGRHTQHVLSFRVWLKLLLLSVGDFM